MLLGWLNVLLTRPGDSLPREPAVLAVRIVSTGPTEVLESAVPTSMVDALVRDGESHRGSHPRVLKLSGMLFWVGVRRECHPALAQYPRGAARSCSELSNDLPLGRAADQYDGDPLILRKASAGCGERRGETQPSSPRWTGRIGSSTYAALRSPVIRPSTLAAFRGSSWGFTSGVLPPCELKTLAVALSSDASCRGGG